MKKQVITFLFILLTINLISPLSVNIPTGVNAGNYSQVNVNYSSDSDKLDGQHGSYYTGYCDTLVGDYVPYTGATQDVDLGVYNLSGHYGLFDFLSAGTDTPFGGTITEAVPLGSAEVNGYLIVKPGMGLIGVKPDGLGYTTLISNDILGNNLYYSMADTIFYVLGVEKMRLNNLGYLGIKVTNPQEKLDLYGNFKHSGNIYPNESRFDLGTSSLRYNNTYTTYLNATNISASFLTGFLNLSYIQNNPWSYNQTISALNIVNSNDSIIKNNTSPTFVNITIREISGACDLTKVHSICANATGTYIVG